LASRFNEHANLPMRVETCNRIGALLSSKLVCLHAGTIFFRHSHCLPPFRPRFWRVGSFVLRTAAIARSRLRTPREAVPRASQVRARTRAFRLISLAAAASLLRLIWTTRWSLHASCRRHCCRLICRFSTLPGRSTLRPIARRAYACGPSCAWI